MKLLTLNCQKGAIEEHKKNLEIYLAELLNNAEFDFVFLQEANHVVTDILESGNSQNNYQIITGNNPLAPGEKMLTVLLIRKDYNVIEQQISSLFDEKINWGFNYYALLNAAITSPKGETLIIGTFHFHGGLYAKSRLRDIKEVKKILLDFKKSYPESQVFFGGDSNSGLPWEPKLFTAKTGPEFINLTNFKNHTVTSERVEPISAMNRFALKLTKLGIKLKFKVDHIFASKEIADKFKIISKPVKVIVSDHYPIMVELIEK